MTQHKNSGLPPSYRPRHSAEHSRTRHSRQVQRPTASPQAAGRSAQDSYEVRNIVANRRAAEDKTQVIDLQTLNALLALSGPATVPMPIPASLRGKAPTQSRLLNLLRDPALRGAIALMLSAVMAGGLGFVFWAVATHRQTAAALGSVSAEVSSISFLAIVGSLNLATFFARFIPEAGWSARRLILVCYGTSAIVGLIAADIFLLTPLANGLVLGGKFGLLAFIICAIVNSVFNVQDGGLIGFGRFGWVPIENTFVAVARLVLLPISVAFFSAKAAILWSWAVPMFVAVVLVNILMVGRLAGQARGQSRLPPFRELGRFVAVDSVTSAVYAAVSALLPALVTHRLGATEGGYFYIPWIIVTMVNLLIMNVFISMVREVVATPSKAKSTILRSTGLVALVIVAVLAACFFMVGLVLAPLGASFSLNGVGLLRWIAMATPATAVIVLFWSVCLVRRRPWPVFGINLGTSAAILVGMFLLRQGASISDVGELYCFVQWASASVVIIPAVRALRAIRNGEG